MSCWKEGNKVELVTLQPGLRDFKDRAEFMLEEQDDRKFTTGCSVGAEHRHSV